ncbi:hypothetical protein ACH5RR_030175 [Cinchona calisaya]|uniref:Uncharacterized protein n=1 Tax=Cinchona calisaya TaxID=153742 RepID=A0ABD2YWX9_9GENT
MANQNLSVPMATDSLQGFRNRIWGAEMKDSLPSRNLTTNHHVIKDPTTNDMDFESLCLFPDVKVLQNSKIPNFTKYGRDGDPLAHVKIFYNEFGARGKDEQEPFYEKLLGLVNHCFSEVVEQREMLEQRIKCGKFANISVPKVLSKRETKDKEKKDKGSTQAYDPSINMISVEKNLDDSAKLTIPESEIIKKFSQMHLRLKGKTTISEESKPVPEMVTREEFFILEGQLENMQLVNKILWDTIRALEENMAELTSWK